MALVKKCRHGRGLSEGERLDAWAACACSWYADLRAGGKRIYVRLGPDARAAAAQHRQLLVEQRAGALVRPSDARTFREAADDWIAMKRHAVRAQSLARYEDHLAHAHRYFGDGPVGAIRSQHLAAFAQSLLDAGLSPGVVRTVRNLTHAVLRHAALRGAIAAAPELPRLEARERSHEGKARAMSLDAARAVIAALPAPERHLSELVLWTGLRPSEAVALTAEDVAGDSLHVRRTVIQSTGQTGPPKTKAGTRTVDLIPAARAVLEHAEQRGQLFRTTYRRWSGRWAAACRDARVPAEPLKALRHTNASLRLAAGQSLAYIAAQMGHASPAVTLSIYSHLVPGLPSEADRLSALTGHGAP